MSRANRILILATFFGFIGVGLFGPIYAIFVKQIGGDVLEAGMAYALFSIISGIFIFLIGSRDFFKKHLRGWVVAGYFLYTAGNAGYLLVGNPMQLFAVQIILGIAGGILEPSWDGIFSANLNEETAAEFWSKWAGVRDISIGIGAIFGGILVAIYSFQVLFIVLTIVTLAAAVTSLALLKKPLTNKTV